jgi:hypothetical protein
MPTYNPDGSVASFDPDCIAQVQARIPCLAVSRSPFPRGLVSVANHFSLGGPNTREEWSTPPLPEGIPEAWRKCGDDRLPRYKNWQIGLKWVRIGSPAWNPGAAMPGPYPPDEAHWNFDDRPWSPHGTTSSGNSVAHTYETSSYGLPANGPGGLPSYQVRVRTYWGLFWAAQYDERVCVEWEEVCTCGNSAEYHTWRCPDCDDQHRNARQRCARCEWRHKFDGWHPIDLTQYGSLTWYAESYKIDVPGVGCSGVLPVPIIESQGVIEK